MAGYSQFDPRGIQLAPQYSGQFASTGTIYNPAGAAGAPSPVRQQTQQVQQGGAQQQHIPVWRRPAGTSPSDFMAQQQQQAQQSSNPLINAINGMFGGNTTGTTQGNSNIQTSINPSNIYSPQQTQEAANQARAGQSVPLPWLQGRFAGNGMSVNSPGVVTQSLPAYAQGLTGGMTAQAQIPFQDTRADAQHYLAGQQGRENEAQGWARMLSSADSTNRNFQMNTLQSILSMLGSLGGV